MDVPLTGSGGFAQNFGKPSLEVLYVSMRKTAKARFNCSKRYKRHFDYSVWSLSLFSAGLIIMPLLGVLKIHIAIPDNYFNLIQIGLAVLVLTTSLLLGSNNYNDKAEKMHRCALELNALAREIQPHGATVELARYQEANQKYTAILNAYENHQDIDFDLVKLEQAADFKVGFLHRQLIRFRYCIDFWFYVVLLSMLLIVFVAMLFGDKIYLPHP